MLILSTLQSVFVLSGIPPVGMDENPMASAHDTSASRSDGALVATDTPVSTSVYPRTTLLPFHGLHACSSHSSIDYTDDTHGRLTSADGRDYSYLSEDPDSGYSTDDTMPSLETVYGSSDDEY